MHLHTGTKAADLVILGKLPRHHLGRWPMMSQGDQLCPSGCGWGDVAKLVGVFDMLPRAGTLGQRDEQLPMGPHLKHPVSLTHLYHASSHWWL
jgi:hypothetical protein